MWTTRKIRSQCVVCGERATVVVLDDNGNEQGLYCGVHADAKVNAENRDEYRALKEAQSPQYRELMERQDAERTREPGEVERIREDTSVAR